MRPILFNFEIGNATPINWKDNMIEVNE